MLRNFTRLFPRLGRQKTAVEGGLATGPKLGEPEPPTERDPRSESGIVVQMLAKDEAWVTGPRLRPRQIVKRIE